MKFNVEATLFSEKNMLFTLKDGEHHADRCIGHVRGDFGSNGNEFHHTWWPQHEELNTDEFKTELTQVVNELRSDSCGLLKSRKSMQSFCCDHARAKLLGHWNSETYGFKICTEKYMYYTENADNGNQNQNDNTTSPQTGDSSNVAVYALLALAAAGMMGVTLVTRKRKSEEA